MVREVGRTWKDIGEGKEYNQNIIVKKITNKNIIIKKLRRCLAFDLYMKSVRTVVHMSFRVDRTALQLRDYAGKQACTKSEILKNMAFQLEIVDDFYKTT